MRKKLFEWLLWGTYWRLVARQKVSDIKTDIMHTNFGRWCIRVVLIAALLALAFCIYKEYERDVIDYNIENHAANHLKGHSDLRLRFL
jgi:hypothetical protein